MKTEIKHCPSCKGDLIDNSKLAQGVKECSECGTRFLILITSTKPRK
jgi:ribosomal protein L37AE/L43A